MSPNYPSWQRELLSYAMRGFIFLVVIILLFFFASMSYRSVGMIGDGTCNIAVYPIEGVILPLAGLDEFSELVVSPRDVENFIKDAESETGIEALVFEINSPGGTPVAAEWIMASVRETSLPTMALVGDMAASGGYMIASAADTIVASPLSEIGSIGVTMSYLDETARNEEDGVTFVELASGRFKDAGNPNKPLTEEERELFQKQLDTIHQEFIDIVATNRLLDVEQVTLLADGSTLLGREAQTAGLVDYVGGRAVMKEKLAEALAIEVEAVEFCEYTSSLW